MRSSSSLRNRMAVAAATEAIRNEAVARRLMWMFLQNATIQNSGESSTDNEIQFVVNDLVNFAAGVDTSA